MATFISRNINLRIWGDKGKWNAMFAPDGNFVTEDEEIISALREHPNFKKTFTEAGTVKAKGNIIQGTRSAATQPIRDKDAKLLRLGELRAKLLKMDGNPRLDASEELINEMKELQGELGV